MGIISGNTCDILTIIPMVVECRVTNSTSPISYDGSAQVLVYGGTAPYSITWSNGQQGSILNNLTPGSYTATTIDYYGDYTATTVCVVESDTFYVNKFSYCDDESSYIYVDLGSQYSTSSIYEFNEVIGCFNYEGQVLFSGDNYSALTISSTYRTCEACNPTPPEPPEQTSLCLSDGDDIFITFYPNGTDSNGNFVWTGDSSMVVSYNTTGNYWEVTPWTFGGTMRLNQFPPQYFPLGTWVNAGSYGGSIWSMTQGDCKGAELSLKATTTSPECVNDTGNVILFGSNGTPPYQYSLPGYDPKLKRSGVFQNLPSGTYVGMVQDSVLDTATIQFKINQGTPNKTYSLSLTRQPIITSRPSTNSTTRSYSFQVNVTPALPIGVSVSFKLSLIHAQEKGNYVNGQNTVQFTNTSTFFKNGSAISMSASTPTVIDGITNCSSDRQNISYETTSSTLTLSSGDTINGNIVQNVTLTELSDNCDCPTYGQYGTILQITDVSLSGDNCSSINPTSNQLSLDVSEIGCVS